MQQRSKHRADAEIASPRNLVKGNADPQSKMVKNANPCVLILLFIVFTLIQMAGPQRMLRSIGQMAGLHRMLRT